MFKVGNDIVIFNDEGQMVVRVTDPLLSKTVRALPYVQIMEGDNQILASLPWCEDSCRLFQNIGLNMTGAAPLWHDTRQPLIEGKYKPMPHQLFTAAFITLNPRCYVLNDPRTGKTGSIILAMDYLQRQRFITGGVLILTTVTTIPDVWAGSIQETLPGSLVTIVHGKGREKALETPAEFYVSNYDSARISTAAFVKAVDEGRIGAVVIDELTHVGNSSSGRHQSIDVIVNGAGQSKKDKKPYIPRRSPMQWVIGATGSPGENPETTFGMCKTVNRAKLPCTTKSAWLDLVTFQYGPEPFQRKLSAKAPEIIFNAMQPAVRFAKKDVLANMPPITVQNRTCAMSAEQTRAREEFKTQAVALLESGETISAANGGVLHQKLMQVAQGFVMDNKGEPHFLDHKDRTKVILEAIGETPRKVVVACFYKATIKRLAEDIRKAGYTVGVVDGSITGKTRAETLRNFQNEKDPHVLLIHPTTTAFGTELSAADTMIINGPPPLGGFIWAQLLERMSSTKQTADKLNIIRIQSSPEERKFFVTLDNGKEMGNFISTLFEDFARGIL